jgi:hypothetical protein
LHPAYSFPGVETYKQVSTEQIPTGDVTVKMLFEADECKPGTVKQVVFDVKPAHQEVEQVWHEHESMQAVGQGVAG